MYYLSNNILEIVKQLTCYFTLSENIFLKEEIAFECFEDRILLYGHF